jgi:hypothetical protein
MELEVSLFRAREIDLAPLDGGNCLFVYSSVQFIKLISAQQEATSLVVVIQKLHTRSRETVNNNTFDCY